MNKNRGFTLIEITICVLIFTLIVYPLSRFVYDNFFIANNEMRMAGLNLEVKGVLEDMVSQMRQAEPDGIKLFVDSTDVTEENSGNANKIEITYVYNPANGATRKVGYKVNNYSFIRYNPTVLGDEIELIQNKTDIKRVNAFNIEFENYDVGNKTKAYTKYRLILNVSDGRGSTLAGKKHESNVETSLIKYKTPAPVI